MFRKPKPHGLNGLAEIVKKSDDSKALRGSATRSLIIELEERRKKQQEKTGDEQIATFRRFGVI